MAEWQYTSTSGFVAEYWQYSIARPSADQVLSHTSLGPGLDGDTKYYLLYYILYNTIYYILYTMDQALSCPTHLLAQAWIGRLHILF